MAHQTAVARPAGWRGWHISLRCGTAFRMEDGTSDSCGTACRMERMAHQLEMWHSLQDGGWHIRQPWHGLQDGEDGTFASHYGSTGFKY